MSCPFPYCSSILVHQKSGKSSAANIHEWVNLKKKIHEWIDFKNIIWISHVLKHYLISCLKKVRLKKEKLDYFFISSSPIFLLLIGRNYPLVHILLRLILFHLYQYSSINVFNYSSFFVNHHPSFHLHINWYFLFI